MYTAAGADAPDQAATAVDGILLHAPAVCLQLLRLSRAGIPSVTDVGESRAVGERSQQIGRLLRRRGTRSDIEPRARDGLPLAWLASGRRVTGKSAGDRSCDRRGKKSEASEGSNVRCPRWIER